MSEKHMPAEIFGFPPSNQSDRVNEIRSSYFCPFIEKRCIKQSRLLNYPQGICSVWHKGSPRIICPQRFYFEEGKLLKSIAKEFLGNEFNLIDEVELKGFGNIDWVAFRISEAKEVEFLGMEIMADSTTQTGQLVEALKDFMTKKTLKQRYNYGMNSYNTIKLSFTQMLNKGQVFEKWGKYYVWILQNALFQILRDKFILEVVDGLKEGNKIVFASINMKFDQQNNIFVLELENYYSTSIDKLLHAYKRMDILDMDIFVKTILRKAGITKPQIMAKKLTEF